MTVQRKISKVINAEVFQEDGLFMYQPIPSREVVQIDPFLLLHHHGPLRFPPDNRGLPFGPHPHRGFETVTLIFEGNVKHADSRGNKSTIYEGGIQWMTAAMGIVHSENISKEMQLNGGDFEIIQLWINLPARLKMGQPNYQGFQKDQIPALIPNRGVTLDVFSGMLEGASGPVHSITNIHLNTLFMEPGSEFTFSVEEKRNILFYVLNGEIEVNGKTTRTRQLADFSREGTEIQLRANRPARILIATGEPIGEPVVQHGPFVMNTQTEILEAMRDYRMGRMGILIED